MQFVPLGDGLKDIEAAAQQDSGPASSLCCLHGLLKWIIHPQAVLIVAHGCKAKSTCSCSKAEFCSVQVCHSVLSFCW